MEVEQPNASGDHRKRKRIMHFQRKLLTNEKVEVRSMKDEFQGSWHSGTIIECEKQGLRRIIYDKQSGNLLDDVSISPFLDRVDFGSRDQRNHRGNIRPLPPQFDFTKWNIHYGLCVDAYYNDAWWEGVVFDREDGLEKRKIFFPDSDDEIVIGINFIRITQDWDEITGVWKQRGNWIFLELLEKYEEKSYISVSVKQLWYDVRQKEAFKKIKEWTSTMTDLWNQLTSEVFEDNFRIIVNELFNVIVSDGLSSEFQVALESDQPMDFSAAQGVIKCSNENILPQASYDLPSYLDDDGISGNVTNEMNKNFKRSELKNTKKWLPVPQHPEPVFNPNAIGQYYAYLQTSKSERSESLKEILSDLKKHMSYLGWKFESMKDNYALRQRYVSPDGKVFYSFHQVCKHLKKPSGDMLFKDDWIISNISFSDCQLPELQHETPDPKSSLPVTAIEKPEYCSQPSCRVQSNKINNHLLVGESQAQKRKTCQRFRKLRQLKNKQHVTLPRVKEGKQSRAPKDRTDAIRPARVLRSCSKRVQEVVTPLASHSIPRTVLSWLIDNNVVVPREKVYYCSIKGSTPIKEGKITRYGIKCSCCQKVFTIKDFEGHAGGEDGRRTANIFLESGQSLLECQIKIIGHGNYKGETCHTTSGNLHKGENDYICSVCYYGGELVLCDQCPSSFHKECLGLKDIPDGDWFCPSCCCGICRLNEFQRDTEHTVDNIFIACAQCERKFHRGCLKTSWIVTELERYSRESWFCSTTCKKIFSGLQSLIGKSIPVGEDNLTWTLLKFVNPNICHTNTSDEIGQIENVSKLNVALEVMHECFEPVKEPLTDRDLVEDVIFCRGSDLNRLSFQGFYIVVLESNDQLITVATVRVYGHKVAEVPLIGTRCQHRRHGMCRMLMNVLEKELMRLGVERLVLPAIPSVLNTWTTSFGFSPIEASERLQFLDYTFLDFQGTIMCQKLLAKIPSAKSSLSKETRHKLHDEICGNDNNDFDNFSPVSEVYQAEQIEDSRMVNQ